MLSGNRVVEVRPRGVNKGLYVRQLFPNGRSPDRFVLCAGDDRTDRHMLEALPMGAAGIHVGPLAADLRSPGNCVAYTLDAPADVRALLRDLLDAATRD